jgi:hypothetical protein
LNLIIVEGIPGSGKSTTARFIALQSERNGLRTKLFHESSFEHPILLDNEVSYSVDWRNIYLSNWSKFLAEQANDNSVIVMESILFQSPIINLLHSDIDREEIVQFIEELYSLLAATSCHVVYLYQGNSTVGISRMITSRGGETWLMNTYEKYKHEPYYLNRGQRGKELHIDFLHEYSTIANLAYSKCSLKSLAIDNTTWDWPSYYDRLLNFLELAYIPDPVLSIHDLKKFMGLFRNEEMGLTIQIEIKDHELIIFGNQRLKPRDLNKFYLDNISISLEYIVDSAGVFSALIIYEKDIVGNRSNEGTRFVRIS